MKRFFIGRTRSVHIQFLRYLFVGGSSTIVDLAVFAAAFQYFGIHYLLAAFIAYMLGLSWNYYFGLLWVFESRHRRALEFMMVFLIALGGLLWTEILLWLAVELVHLAPMAAKLIVVWIVLLWNFGMRKLYVFH